MLKFTEKNQDFIDYGKSTKRHQFFFIFMLNIDANKEYINNFEYITVAKLSP